MAQGVVDQRLQQQSWHPRLTQLGRHVDAHEQAFGEAHPHQIEIEIEQAHFLA